MVGFLVSLVAGGVCAAVVLWARAVVRRLGRLDDYGHILVGEVAETRRVVVEALYCLQDHAQVSGTELKEVCREMREGRSAPPHTCAPVRPSAETQGLVYHFKPDDEGVVLFTDLHLWWVRWESRFDKSLLWAGPFRSKDAAAEWWGSGRR